MPELKIEITGVEPLAHSLTPLLQFKLRITAGSAEPVAGLLLNAQIQLQCPQRSYNAQEKARLIELFGPPERWGQTLRNRLWALANTNLGPFTGSVEASLTVPCTYDLNLAAAKYLYALEGGEVSLLFLFTGSVFYLTEDGRLQVERISWNSEAVFVLPLVAWRTALEAHYPNSAWLTLRREVFDRLCEYKRRQTIVTWEETMDRLLEQAELAPAVPAVLRPTPPIAEEVPA